MTLALHLGPVVLRLARPRRSLGWWIGPARRRLLGGWRLAVERRDAGAGRRGLRRAAVLLALLLPLAGCEARCSVTWESRPRPQETPTWRA